PARGLDLRGGQVDLVVNLLLGTAYGLSCEVLLFCACGFCYQMNGFRRALGCGSVDGQSAPIGKHKRFEANNVIATRGEISVARRLSAPQFRNGRDFDHFAASYASGWNHRFIKGINSVDHFTDYRSSLARQAYTLSECDSDGGTCAQSEIDLFWQSRQAFARS